ncbi:MAG TPA: efflux RND transporter periplasmic adaptor subunit [Bacteroidales bacterium]|nr:efflux RND transporter periplasmic adaptor subunit [Bacteroidales bacterium]
MKNLNYIFLLLFLAACHSKQPEQNDPPANDTASDKVTVAFSPAQINMAEIKTGKLKKRVLSAFVECNGTIELPPSNLATVSAPINGFVKEAYFFPGNHVKKGELLAILQHPDYIKLQQDYLEAKNQVSYLHEEFKRQGELTVENAASIKSMQKAQSEFRSNEARMLALAAQLKMLGIDPEKITVDGITPEIKIYAPISGYITRINANIGKFIDSYEVMYEIVDKSHLHLNLKVYERDMFNLKRGQRISFSILEKEAHPFEARIETIGQMIDEELRTIDVHAHITRPDPSFTPGMFVNAKIYLHDDSLYSLPVTALIKKNEHNFIFVKEGARFVRTPVETGIEEGDYAEIKNVGEDLKNAVIVTKGAYYLESETDNQTE